MQTVGRTHTHGRARTHVHTNDWHKKIHAKIRTNATTMKKGMHLSIRRKMLFKKMFVTEQLATTT